MFSNRIYDKWKFFVSSVNCSLPRKMPFKPRISKELEAEIKLRCYYCYYGVSAMYDVSLCLLPSRLMPSSK